MKQLFEQWRDYLKEEGRTFPFQIYCDLDGVLVGFEEGAAMTINDDLADPNRVDPRLKKKYDKMVHKLKEAGRTEPLEVTPMDFSKENKEGRINAVRNYMYPRLQNDLEFWANLEWQQPDGVELWNHIKNFDPPPLILTAPMRGDPEGGDHQGKREWVKRNLGISNDRVIVEPEKQRHAVAETGQQNVLIDDTDKKINAWREAGGIGILHKHGQTSDTIAKLNHLRENSDVPEEPLE